ncbi:MAG: TPM domain-containing protein [Rhodobacteraceae bacterium]|nr:TPM domain-containing protein [Paracoccaceae bacterium]
MGQLLAIVLAWLLAFAGPGLTGPLPLRAAGHVTDLAGVIDTETARQLEDRLATLTRETGIDMVVLTVPQIAAYDGATTVEGFAREVFDGWALGSATRNDGILALVVTDQQVVRIELGAGYDQGYDPIAQDVIDRHFKPAFIAGDLSGGIAAGVAATIDTIAMRKAAPSGNVTSATGGGSRFWIFAVGAAFIAALAYVRRRGRAAAPLEIPCPQCGAAKPRGGPCPACGHTRQREDRDGERIRSRPDRDDNRPEGGGRSDGGGATGRW